jgi:hypothetical protein
MNLEPRSRPKLALALGACAALAIAFGEALRLLSSPASRAESPVRLNSVGWDDQALKKAVDEGRAVEVGAASQPALQPGTGSVFGAAFVPVFDDEAGGRTDRDPRSSLPYSSAYGAVSSFRCPRASLLDPIPDLGVVDAIPRSSPDYSEPIRFRTDKQGRFRVDNVPAGRVLLSFGSVRYSGRHRIAYVREGQSTEVRLLDPSAAWNMTCQFVIGDGSPAQYLSGTGTGAKRKVKFETTELPRLRIGLEPIGNEPVSFDPPDLNELGYRRRIVLHDVHPGKYHVAIAVGWHGAPFGWYGEPAQNVDPLNRELVPVEIAAARYRGIVAQLNVDFEPGQAAFRIPLGAGCITGCITSAARGQVIAIGKKSHTFRDDGWCDDDGNFCLRYLIPDEYVLFARDHRGGGWCRLGQVSVANHISDVGTHQLTPGGTILCQLPASASSDPLAIVKATDSQGFVIEEPQHDDRSARLWIPSLWPGNWTVTLSRCDQEIALKAVVLRGTETVSCNFGGKR